VQARLTNAVETPASEAVWTVIGRVVGPHGVKGELKIHPDSDFPERFLTPGDRWLRCPSAAEPQAVTLLSGRFLEGKGLYVIKLAEITQRQHAEALRQGELLVPASDRPSLDEGEFYVQDLVGLAVRLTHSDEVIGRVVDVLTAGNDLLAIELFAEQPVSHLSPSPSTEIDPLSTASSRRQRRQGHRAAPNPRDTLKSPPPKLVPFVHAIVPRVNLTEGWVEITPPPGLLD
jgi:16S rRNA processing protein RimM